MQITKNHQLFLLKSSTVSVCVPVIATTDLCMADADTVWSGNIRSDTIPNSYSGQHIYIADSLIVNDTLEFFNCSIIMAGSASITVVNPGYLTSQAFLNPNTNYSAQREIDVGQIDDQQAIIEDALQQQKSLDVSFISQAENANNLVSSTELPDENEKFINTMAVLLLREGVSGIASYYTPIFTIAN